MGQNVPEIFCDSDAITRVFVNLFSNAIKYSLINKNRPERSQITCTIKRIRHEIIVAISDNALGIDKEEKESQFNRFLRSTNEEHKFIAGTGLGLWISKQIITAHRGRIWVSSEKGRGSNFAFALSTGHNDNDAEIWLY